LLEEASHFFLLFQVSHISLCECVRVVS
jgi:hypothetical protein